MRRFCMLRFFKPDMNIDKVTELTGEFLLSKGISVLIADLDNTLAPYSAALPPEEIKAWVKSLSECGIRLAVVSNNKEERVKKFCEPLGIRHYWKSGKPSRRTILAAMVSLGGTIETTALVGDKTITDIFGAVRSGIFAVKVRPIGRGKNEKKDNDN